MLKTITTILALFITTIIAAQSSIKLEDVKKHIGDSVTVCGKVFTARYFENSKGTPTLLNLGAAFPNQLLTVVIWDDVRKQLETKPEELYLNKEICVTGRIELYKEKPQIILKAKNQLFCKGCD